MPWNNQGGGGGSGGGGGPWGGGGQGPWGRGPGGGGGGGPKPPNIDELLRRGNDWLRNQLPRGAAPQVALAIGLGAIGLVWLATGIYRVLPEELGVVMRFGKYQETTQPGLHYHLPMPIESVLTPAVTRVNRTEIGVSTETGSRTAIPSESLMLTGDENIVDINLSVFWRIKDARAYLFDIRNPEGTVKSAAESALREIVGRTPIANVLSDGRRKVETDTEELLQQILDSYGAGIQLTQVQLQKVDPPQQVIGAYRDVQQARTDLERARNEAEAYRNDIVPRARGEAERQTQDAEAYKQEIVARAQGDAQRFQSVYGAYKAAKDVTAERLYLETMEQVMKNARKVIVDRQASGVVPYLPLGDLSKPPAPPDPAAVQGKPAR